MLTSTALLSLQPNIINVNCTEEIATIEWINRNQNANNAIWGYCVHHYCNTPDDVVVGETVSVSKLSV